jgi:hypothetical protein
VRVGVDKHATKVKGMEFHESVLAKDFIFGFGRAFGSIGIAPSTPLSRR